MRSQSRGEGPGTRLARRAAFLLSPAGLWLALVPVATFSAIVLTPVYPTDFWWHLAAGERFWAGEGILRADPYSFLGEGRPFQHQAWLAGALLALVHGLGGVPLLLVTNALLYSGAYVLVLAECRHLNGGVRAATLATLLGFALSAENWALRPQSFSVLLLPITLLILRRYAGGRAPALGLAVLPLLTALWANLHGAFVLGLLAQGVVTAGVVLERLLPAAEPFSRESGGQGKATGDEGSDRPAGFTLAGGKPAVWPLVAAGIASATAVGLNPWGLGAYGYVLSFVRDPVHRAFSQEWAATDFSFSPGRVFFAFLALLLAVLVLSRRVPRPGEVLLLLGFGALALSSVRNVIWFGLVAAPPLAEGLTLMAQRLSLVRRIGPASGMAARSGLLPLSAIALLSLACLPWVRPVLPLPEAQRALVTADTPIAAAAVFREMEPGRRTYHDMQYGSYLIWAAYPRQQVFLDPRFELYSYDEWSDYGRMAVGRDPWPLLEQYRIDTLVLHRERQAGLIAAVAADGRWEPVYEDRFTGIYRRH